MSSHEKINYLEIPARNLEKTKVFLAMFLAGLSKILVASTRPFLMRELREVFLNPISVLPQKTAVHWLFSTVPNWRRRKQKLKRPAEKL